MPFFTRLKKHRPDWLTLLLVGLVVYLWFRPPASVTPLDQPVANASVPLLSGQTVNLRALRGKVVLVNFWATWCPYCRHEMPAMQAFYQDYRSQGFDILALSSGEEAATVRQFMTREGYTFPAGVATAEVADVFGRPASLPTSFLIDRQGRIRHKIAGQVHYARLQSLVEPLLRERLP
jgi:peroxiredoxin